MFTIVVIPVGKPAEVREVEALDLETMQGIVGGLIEAVALPSGDTLWVNEEGLATCPPNFGLGGRIYFGQAFITGGADEDGETQGLGSAHALRVVGAANGLPRYEEVPHD